MKKTVLRECLRQAMDSVFTHPRVEKSFYLHYTYVVQRNKVLGRGTNIGTEPPIHYGYSEHQIVHSEINAYIRNRSFIDTSKKFYAINISVSKTLRLRDAKPCIHCECMLRELGFSGVYYTTQKGFEYLAL